MFMCGLALRRWPALGCVSVTISPGDGTDGSAIWRFMMTWDRRRPAVGDCRFSDDGL